MGFFKKNIDTDLANEIRGVQVLYQIPLRCASEFLFWQTRFAKYKEANSSSCSQKIHDVRRLQHNKYYTWLLPRALHCIQQLMQDRLALQNILQLEKKELIPEKNRHVPTGRIHNGCQCRYKF